MNRIVFARWELESDPAKTRELYRQLASGAAEACGCAPCRNFITVRGQVYPPDVRRLFDELGIASDREAEVYHTHRVELGKHHYGGWFHFVGRIVSGADAARQIRPNAWTFELETVDRDFQLGFTNRIGLRREPFKGYPVVQLEFQAIAPWRLNEQEPTR